MKKFALSLLALFLAVPCISQVVFRDSVTNLYGVHAYNEGNRTEYIAPKYDFMQRSSDSIFLAVEGKKFGVVSKFDSLLIPIEYDAIFGIAGDLVSVEQEGKYGVVMLSNKILYPCKYENTIDVAKLRKDRYVHTTLDGKFVLLTDSGSHFGNLTFDEPIKFYAFRTGNLLECRSGGKWGVINKKGEVVIPFKYAYLSSPRYNTDYLRYRSDGDGWYGILTLDGREITKPIYSDIKRTYCGEFGKYIVREDREKGKRDSTGRILGTVGLLNAEGKTLLPCKYRSIYCKGKWFEVSTDRGYGIADTTGKVVIPPIYAKIKYYDGTFAAVKIGEKYGFVDGRGNVLVKPTYEKVKGVNGNVVLVRINDEYCVVTKAGEKVADGPFSKRPARRAFLSESLIYLQEIGGYSGVIDTAGNTVIPFQFSRVQWHATHFAVTQGGRQGVYDHQGNCLIKPKYDRLISVNDSFFIATLDTLAGILTHDGRIAVPFAYDDIESDGSNFIVTKDGKKGLIDHTGKIIHPIQYKTMKRYYDYHIVDNFEAEGVIDLKGNNVIPFEYDEIYKSQTKDVLIVRKLAKYGLINLENEIVLSIAYDRIQQGTCRKNGIQARDNSNRIPCLWVRKDGYYALYSPAGVQVTAFKYRMIALDRGGITVVQAYSEGSWLVLSANGSEHRWAPPPGKMRRYD